MGDALVSEQLHAYVCLDLLSVFGPADAKNILIILLSLFIRMLFLDLVKIVFDNHCLKNRMCVFMLSIKRKLITQNNNSLTLFNFASFQRFLI